MSELREEGHCVRGTGMGQYGHASDPFFGSMKMAEEPGLKTHWSDQLPYEISREQWDDVQKQLAEASQAKERVQGIVLMCGLDQDLEQLLRTVMIDDPSVSTLMKDDRLLGSFSSKLKLAHALGLISEMIRKDLYFLNKIRNAFAHEADVTSFDVAPVCDLCKNLSAKEEKAWQGLPPRKLHLAAVAANSFYLKAEAERRGEKKASLESPPADFTEAMHRRYRDIPYLRCGVKQTEKPK